MGMRTFLSIWKEGSFLNRSQRHRWSKLHKNLSLRNQINPKVKNLTRKVKNLGHQKNTKKTKRRKTKKDQNQVKQAPSQSLLCFKIHCMNCRRTESPAEMIKTNLISWMGKCLTAKWWVRWVVAVRIVLKVQKLSHLKITRLNRCNTSILTICPYLTTLKKRYPIALLT